MDEKQAIDIIKKRAQKSIEELKQKLDKSVEKYTKEEEPMKKTRVRLSKDTKVIKKSSKKVRIRLPENDPRVESPWLGVVPGSSEWISIWEKMRHDRKKREAMLEYRKEYEAEHKEETVKTKEQKEEEKRKKLIERYIKKNGVEKVKPKAGKGEAAELLEDEDEDEEDYEDEYVGDDDMEFVEEIRKTPKKVVKQFFKKVKEEKTGKPTNKHREVMNVSKTIGKPFGSEGRTIDLYTVKVPDEVNTVKKLIKWMKEERRPIVELDKESGELRAYQRERVTASGRVAKVTVKKQGERHLVTYRSNKNSRHE